MSLLSPYTFNVCFPGLTQSTTVRLAECLHSQKSHTISRGKKTEKMFREISNVKIVFERISGWEGGKCLWRWMFLFVHCPQIQVYITASGHIVCFIISEGNRLFFILTQPPLLPVSAQKCAPLRSPHRLPLCKLRDRSMRTQRSQEQEVGGVGLFRYGSTLT